MSVTRLVLVRHGESVAQQEGFLAGHEGCRGLSARGRRQAQALARRLAGGELGPVSALYASRMRRAVETAEIVGGAIGHSAPTLDCGLCELHPGEADGLAWEEIARRWPYPEEWSGDPFDHVIDGAESWPDMRRRVERTLDRLATDHAGETVVIVCHGGVVAQAVNARLGVPIDAEVAWLVAANTSLTEFVLDHGLGDWRAGRWGVVRFNDAAHVLDTE